MIFIVPSNFEPVPIYHVPDAQHIGGGWVGEKFESPFSQVVPNGKIVTGTYNIIYSRTRRNALISGIGMGGGIGVAGGALIGGGYGAAGGNPVTIGGGIAGGATWGGVIGSLIGAGFGIEGDAIPPTRMKIEIIVECQCPDGATTWSPVETSRTISP